MLATKLALFYVVWPYDNAPDWGAKRPTLAQNVGVRVAAGLTWVLGYVAAFATIGAIIWALFHFL